MIKSLIINKNKKKVIILQEISYYKYELLTKMVKKN
jgi:hypothetical protein